MSRLSADGLLLVTAFLWGVTFVAQKSAAATMPALAFVAARFAVSAVVLAPLALWEFRRKPHRPGRDDICNIGGVAPLAQEVVGVRERHEALWMLGGDEDARRIVDADGVVGR